MRSRVIGIAAAILALPLATPAIVWRHDVGDAAYVNFGNQFQSVGYVSNVATGAFGSGTLIGSNWVLTAWHVVEGAAGPANNWRFGVNGVEYTASNVFLRTPPLQGFANVVNAGQDLALIQLDTNVTGVTPSQLFNGTFTLGTQGAMVGYGLNGPGTGTTETRGIDGQRRAATNLIEFYATLGPSGLSGGTTPTRTVISDFDAPTGFGPNLFGTAAPEALEGNVDSGDSGGGLFFNVGGSWQLAGVTSFKGGDGGYGSVSGWNLVQPEIAWINSITAIPEPTTMAVLALGAVAALRRKRKSS
jgi:secreted trypsin-like serine protease